VVEDMVKEVSIKMNDPTYVERMVSSWIAAQPHVTQYLASRQAKLGGAEGVINVVFHAAVLATCFLRHNGRSLSLIDFPALDRASRLDQIVELKKRQPQLEAYLGTNVEGAEARKVLILLVLVMDDLS
jgi:hypothetical protein